MQYNTTVVTATLAMALALIEPAFAANISTVGKAQTYGAVSTEASVLGTIYNPASGALVASRLDSDKKVVGELAMGGDLEYGDVEDLFDLIDSLSDSLSDSDAGSGGGDGGNGSAGGGSDLGNIIDINDPQLADLIDRVGVEAQRLGTVLAIVASEGYARANIDGKASLILNSNIAGGTLSFDYISNITSGLVGVVDDVEFDSSQALNALEAAYNLADGDLPTRFDLTGGVFLSVDPSSGATSVEFENDSLLLTRSARVQEFSLGYSQQAGKFESGNLYWGVAPKVIVAGLSNVAVRIGDITDSEKIFDDIRDAEFTNDTAFGMNAGVVWNAENYSVGATVQDLIEADFDFPSIDTSDYTNENIISGLNRIETYKLERQLKLEGNYTSDSRRWSFNGVVDANAIHDVIGFEYQWLSLSGGYHSGNWIVPDVRVGFHQNLVGSELSYMAAGVTLLKFINLDVSSTLDSVDLDGTSVPRGLDISLSFNYGF